MNQLEETLGGWVRFLFVAFTGRVDTCWFGIHEAFAINVAPILPGFELFAMMNIITACFAACLSAGILRIKFLNPSRSPIS